jgi:hypothetical protein
LTTCAYFKSSMVEPVVAVVAVVAVFVVVIQVQKWCPAS